jgi:S-formylglutathione hydrolase
LASKLEIALVCPDTSPRISIDGDSESWDFGTGAGFYVDATTEKWSPYKMFSYINKELFELVSTKFNLDSDKCSIFGHSMGGHGALISALKNPSQYKSVSCFAPISNPINCPWGKKAFKGYLGFKHFK